MTQPTHREKPRLWKSAGLMLLTGALFLVFLSGLPQPRAPVEPMSTPAQTTIPQKTEIHAATPVAVAVTEPAAVAEPTGSTFLYEAPAPKLLPARVINKDIASYALAHGKQYLDYPEKIIALYERNPDARDFCLRYPWLIDAACTADMSVYADTEGVPLFLQWDPQWGCFDYDTELLALAGCGPTTLAMAAYHFTGDPDMNPLSLAQFAMDNGYRYPGNGTAWSFMYDGARQLGLQSRTLPLHEETIIQTLEDGALIICIMGPGQFTSGGHFILLTGYENGSFTINDCNSITRSQRTWTYEEICGEIRNLWAISG